VPQNRFRHPEDAREQLMRGLDLHEQVFGIRPRGVWPSEGSVSEEVLAIAQPLGVNWMATDEGVLGRTLGINFSRDGNGRLPGHADEKLYTIHKYQNGETEMNLIFRDHAISDLVGFVYSGMPPQDAANHLLHNIIANAQPILQRGRDAVVPLILDGENAWEYYPCSGREFLRRFYDALRRTPGVEAVTVSEAIERQSDKPILGSLVPGSWINANFNVWIGAPEDNRAWDYLYHARNFFAENAARASAEQRRLAFEEILIAEGSDWNWWYGPEHHSANDREFDELYRKHLSNVYQALGARPPEYLAQPIMGGTARPSFLPQTAYIHPRVTGDMIRYFEWMGAAVYTAVRRSGTMHGKRFLLDSVFAGIDERSVYGRLDFCDGQVPEMNFELVVKLESWAADGQGAQRTLRINVEIEGGRMRAWKVSSGDDNKTLATSRNPVEGVAVALGRNFECKLPLPWLVAPLSSSSHSQNDGASAMSASKLRLRFSLWQGGLPVDALPVEGWVELQLLSEQELVALA